MIEFGGGGQGNVFIDLVGTEVNLETYKIEVKIGRVIKGTFKECQGICVPN
jgi:hypothetical protein